MSYSKDVVVTGYGVSIGIRKKMLVIRDRDGSKQEFSPRTLRSLIIASSGVSITSRAVRFLMDAGVDIVFLDSHGLPIGRIYPPFINRTVDTRIKQYRVYDTEFGYGIAKTIAYSKIANQAGHVKYYARRLADESLRSTYYSILEELGKIEEIEAADLGSLRKEIVAIEAKAAQKYWFAIARILPRGIGFNGRNQAGRDPFNLSLNYLYGVLYREAWRVLVLAGLDPYLGYIHVERSGKPVLAFDYVEMFRVSCVDYPLTKAFYKGWKPVVDENGVIDYSSRVELIKLFKDNMERRVGYNRKERGRLDNVFKRIAFELASCVRDYKEFKGFIEDW